MENEHEKGEEPAVFDITALDTYVLIELLIDVLGMQAWQHMGLRVKAGSDKVEKDFERAKVAIDCIAFLIDKVEPHIQDSDRSKLRNLLSDLQINFVRLTT